MLLTLLSKEKAHSIWQVVTFGPISSVLEHGAGKQLDFEDLLELPVDMDPLSCHLMLLSCWERQKKTGHPSLFRAICSAYGWSYIRLGLLKVYYREAYFYNNAKYVYWKVKVMWKYVVEAERTLTFYRYLMIVSVLLGRCFSISLFGFFKKVCQSNNFASCFLINEIWYLLTIFVLGCFLDTSRWREFWWLYIRNIFRPHIYFEVIIIYILLIPLNYVRA